MLGRNVGRYHVIAKLGEGGMGSVWKAQDPGTGRIVALKFLPEEAAHSDHARRRFLRGARAVAALEHPYIAPLYEIGEANGELFLAGAFVPGETIAARVARGSVPWTTAVRLAAQAAAALAHAHARRVVHRDITSRNLMITPEDDVRVIDFGIAFHAEAAPITSSDMTIGTLHYMAPEALQGKRVDERGDVYALGVVLYEMLTGAVPFSGEKPGMVVYRVVALDPVPPSQVVSAIPAALDEIVLGALARDPAARYPSAAAMADALNAVLAGERPGTAPGAGAPAPIGTRDTTSPIEPIPAIDPPPTQPILVRLPQHKRVVVPSFHESSIEAGAGGVDPAFAAGVADELAAALARDPDLQVVPAAVLRPDDLAKGIVVAARNAGANLVILGRIHRSGGLVRASFSLLDAAEGTLLGGDSVEGPTSDWFRVGDQLLERVTRSLAARPPARRVGRLERPAAHQAYLEAAGRLQRGDDEDSIRAAVRQLETLAATEGDSAAVESLRARAYIKMFVLTRDLEWIHRAEAACREALRLDPLSPEVLVSLGEIQILTGHPGEAVETLQQSLRLREQNPETHQLLSQAYDALGDPIRAESSCRRAIELRPGYWGAINRLGALMFRQGNYSGAAEQWRRVLELTPDNTHGMHNLAAAHFAMGELEESARGYRRSLAARPSAVAFTGLGTVQFFMGEPAAARDSFRQATTLRPRDASMWGNLADAERWLPGAERDSQAHFVHAIELVRHQLELNPGDGESWSRLALWLSKCGRTSESLNALDRARELVPTSASTGVAAVTVHLLAGNRERARECFRTAWNEGWSRVELERDPELEGIRRDVA